MSAHFTTPTDELLLLAETLGEVKTKAEKLEAEFSTQARPLEAATNALSAALSGIKALQFHVLDNNLGALSARVEEMRKAVDEQVGVIALELKKADETNAAKAGQEAEALRSEIAALQAQLGTLGAQFSAQLERVEFSAKEEAKKLQLIPGPAGAAGASLNPRGTFVDGETYNRLDVVSWLGSSYIAAVDGVTEKPSKNSNQWQVLASRGSGGSGGAGDFGSLAGVAQINQGGTGQTTRAAGLNALLPDQAGATQYMLLTDGAGTVSWGAQPVAGLPSQTSNSGKLLTTNGTSASWSNAVTVSGSNATVTGTLTANGTTFNLSTSGANGSFINMDGLAGNFKIITTRTGGVDRWYFGQDTAAESGSNAGSPFFIRALTDAGAVIDTPLTITRAAGGRLTTPRPVTISDSTASTSTSSGALVVGGGVGVAGNLYVGGSTGVIVTTATYARLTNITSDAGSAADIRLQNTGASGRDIFLGSQGSTSSIVDARSRFMLYDNTGGGLVLSASGADNVKIHLSTASTSTSSGALVVSGGVGVAGAGFFGGNIVAAGNVVCGSATNQAVSVAGGTANDGGNVIVYGSTHASDPNTGRIRVGTTTITSWDSNDFTIASGKGLKVGNAYVAGAPTATGYIVIKDSTGTSYKIPAVAL